MLFLRPVLLTFLFLCFVSGCVPLQPSWKFKPSFYYWKTSIGLDEKTNQYLTGLDVDRLYLRVFDVSWDTKHHLAFPNGVLRVKSGNRVDCDIIPVIFVAREALGRLTAPESKRLAENILELTLHLCGQLKKWKVAELQIDCDWNPSTREAYFELLREIQARMPKLFPGARLSCTIRLSQVKYREAAGIPPVDRGTLMVYHTAYPGKLGSRNTILDLQDAKAYLSSLEAYPLTLDIALPIFSWVVLFNHRQVPLGIVNDVGLEDLKNNADFVEKSHNVFMPVRDTYLRGRLVQKEHWVKLDQPDEDEVIKTIRYLKPRLKNKDTRLILFDFDDSMIRRFTNGKPDRLSKIFDL